MLCDDTAHGLAVLAINCLAQFAQDTRNFDLRGKALLGAQDLGMRRFQHPFANQELLVELLSRTQASEDDVVNNRSQGAFCSAMAEAGHPCEGTVSYVIQGARHEILFETDAMRAEALNLVVDFFDRHV